jgi:hypothetical protein
MCQLNHHRFNMAISDDEDEWRDKEEERNPAKDWEKPMNAERQGPGSHVSFNLDGPTNAGERAPTVVISQMYV